VLAPVVQTLALVAWHLDGKDIPTVYEAQRKAGSEQEFDETHAGVQSRRRLG